MEVAGSPRDRMLSRRGENRKEYPKKKNMLLCSVGKDKRNMNCVGE